MASLLDISIRRAIYGEGLKFGRALNAHTAILRLNDELRRTLGMFDFKQLDELTQVELRKLIRALKNAAKRIFDPWLSSLLDWLQQYVAADHDMLYRLYNAAGFGEPSEDQRTNDGGAALFAAFARVPMAATGTLAVPFLTGIGLIAAVKLERAVMAAYANRASKGDLIRALTGTPQLGRGGTTDELDRMAKAATNTVLAHLAAQSADTVAAALFGFYQWVSILDNRTTAICVSRNGNVYQFGKGPVPPAHVNCRSTITPVADESGIIAPSSFKLWAELQPSEFVKDALDGRLTAAYEGTSALSLADYIAKERLIGL
jgi:SPP1 gp7 family putative phage head morphogenesis protein